VRALIVGLIVVISSSAHGAASLQNFTVTSSQGSNAIFVDVGAAQSRTRGAGYNWPVSVNLPLLASQPATVLVNFPDRSTATLIRMRSRLRGPDHVMWAGYGDGCSGIFSSWTGGFVGTVSCLNTNYGVAVTGGSYQLTRYDSVPGAMETAWEKPPPKSNSSPSPAQTPSTPTQVDTTIDIMVLYTDAVRNHFGSKGATVANIQHYVDVLQQALDASSPAIQSMCGPPTTPSIAEVNLVATKNVSRTENNDDFDSDLAWMSDNVTPGAEVYALRQFWRADVMMYLTEDTGSTYGQSRQPNAGYPGPGPDFMHDANSVLMRSHALNDDTGDAINQPFVFMHEFGHTIGADHDYGNAVNTVDPVENWSYGHFANELDGSGKGARTIMSYYVSGVGGCGTSSANCPRVLHFSNASICDDWFRTGLKDHHENARTIADFGPSVTAQYQLSLGRIFYDGFDP